MAQAPVKVTQNGRVTIPKEIREEYGLSDGDYVVITVDPIEDNSNE